MRLTQFVIYFSLFFGFFVLGDNKQRSVPIEESLGRSLCTTLTQGQQVRFEQCMNGEVMTGIRSLDPLTVYCTRLLANCPNRNPSEDTRRETGP